jgi:hypothetical protein
MSNVISWPRRPERAIIVHQLAPGGKWAAYYAGDEWTPTWQDKPAPCPLIVKRNLNFTIWPRNGLPVIFLDPFSNPEDTGRAA